MIRLFAITDSERFPDFLEQSEELCRNAEAGSVAIVLRERTATARRQFDWARKLRTITARCGQRLFIADRVDLATLVGADGVHLPAAGLPPSRIDPSSGLEISRSGHDLNHLLAEDWRRLSAVWISPIFAARKGREPTGVEGLSERIVALKARAPHLDVYALGGLTSAHVAACLTAGATGVAAIGAVWEPEERVRLLGTLAVGP